MRPTRSMSIGIRRGAALLLPLLLKGGYEYGTLSEYATSSDKHMCRRYTIMPTVVEYVAERPHGHVAGGLAMTRTPTVSS